MLIRKLVIPISCPKPYIVPKRYFQILAQCQAETHRREGAKKTWYDPCFLEMTGKGERSRMINLRKKCVTTNLYKCFSENKGNGMIWGCNRRIWFKCGGRASGFSQDSSTIETLSRRERLESFGSRSSSWRSKRSSLFPALRCSFLPLAIIAYSWQTDMVIVQVVHHRRSEVKIPR